MSGRIAVVRNCGGKIVVLIVNLVKKTTSTLLKRTTSVKYDKSKEVKR